MTAQRTGQTPEEAGNRYARETWRNLRLSMIAVVAGLAAAVVYEHLQVAHDCFETSISSYYYTPARAVFVAALCAIAVAMVCLRGNTAWEDVLLNLGGMFAPVVAFVPTYEPDVCGSAGAANPVRAANVSNNFTALLIVGAFVLAVALWRARREDASLPASVGLGVAIAVWALMLVLFESEKSWFDSHAHGYSATAMFLCISAVAAVNALEVGRRKRERKLLNRYTPVAAAMFVVVIAEGVCKLAHVDGWAHQTIFVETTLLLLFATFWIMQTAEMSKYESGRRPAIAESS